MNEILLVGGGGHCRSVIDVIELEGKYKIAGIIDKEELIGQEVFGYKVIGCDNDLEKLFSYYNNAVITIGQIHSNSLRVKIFKMLKSIGYTLPIIKSPLSYISKYATIDEGTVILHHALVNAGSKIGKNSIINSKALIEHDVEVGNHCHISTGAILNGGLKVLDNSFVGSNATSKEYSTVEGFVKAGSIIQ